MRISVSTKLLRRWFNPARVMSIAVLGLSLSVFSCGDASDPDAVKQDELKRPEGLTILDQGNGSLLLSWTGNNNESKFDGYEVFGMADNGSLGTTEGEAISLLDDAGSVNTAAKAILQNYNFDPDNPFNKAGAKPTESGDFYFLPHYNKDTDGTALLPSCRPTDTSGTCTEITSATKSTATVPLNGRTSFTVTGLTMGQPYCFFVMTSMKAGKKVSASSSEVVCTTPKYSMNVQLTTDSTNNSIGINLDNIRANCATVTTTKTGCPDLSTFSSNTHVIPGAGLADASSTQPLYLERILNGGVTNYYFTSGANAGILDLGYYANGFSDAKLVDYVNKFVPNSTTSTTENPTGYSLSGQSIRVVTGNHVYVVAYLDSTTSTAAADAKKYYYDWFWVKDSTVTVNSKFTVEMRVSNKSDVTTN